MNDSSSSSANGHGRQPQQRRANWENLLREVDTVDGVELLIPPIYHRQGNLEPSMGLWTATERRRTRASTIPPGFYQTMWSNRPMNLHQNGTIQVNNNGRSTHDGSVPPSARTRPPPLPPLRPPESIPSNGA
ncbi:MAG: hypothetical protein Q9211_002303 [Gyalolechia sp. 1 TL-2023]